MQHGLDFVRIVRMHSTQGTPLDFDRASTQVRSQLLELLRTLAVADKNYKSAITLICLAKLCRRWRLCGTGAGECRRC